MKTKRNNIAGLAQLNSSKGITLIALVITIVILIILAGVAINLTLGENGIFNKAKYAVEQQKMAEVKERVELAIADIQTDKITKGEECTVDTIISELPGKISGLTISKDGDNAKGTYNGCDFTITPDLKVTIDGYNPSAGGSTGGDTGGNTPTTPPTPTTYSVTFNGTNVTSNGASSVDENATYTATLTATSGYGITSVTVTMGGTALVENTGYTYSNGNLSIPNVSGDIEIVAMTLQTIASKKTSELTYFSEPTTLVDSNGNIVKIPSGFKIASDSGDNVTEGIVIEDNDVKTDGQRNNRGNQYVWIPVGTRIKKADNTTVNITLGRYMFADGTKHKDEEGNTLAKGTPMLKQSAEDYLEETEIDSFYKELVIQRTGVESTGTSGSNTTALNLKGFIDSVNANDGYYIARYEASYGTDGKANSKISTGTPATSDSTTKTEGMLWNTITQIDAATASRGLYSTATTDLINSYAWDTAIVYIQKFSENTQYSYQSPKITSNNPKNTGESGDEVCKINDMASNTYEWTTENSTYYSGRYPCVMRGGQCYDGSDYTCYRNDDGADMYYKNVTFRSVLYMYD